jgi:hypothetical protein
MKLLATITLIICVTHFSSVQAEQFNPTSLDTEISLVATNGIWREGERYGRYRFVVKKIGWEHTLSYIYLQWLHLDQDKKETVIISSKPIREFNTGDWRFFTSVSFENGKYIIKYENRGRETPQEAILIPGGPGKYKINIKDEPFE